MNFLISFYLWIILLPVDPAINRYDVTGFAQGTSYRITYYADSLYVNKEEITAIFSQLDSSLSIYKSYSLINQFNDAPEGVQIDHHLKEVVEKALEISNSTEGAFDIAMYSLVNAWGFGKSRRPNVPDSSEIDSYLSCLENEKIILDNDYLSKTSSCVKIDVNGIAQGYSVDIIANYLERAGIVNYLVEVGGELRVGGSKQPAGEPFIIGLEAPPSDENGKFPSVTKRARLENQALTTSGNYRRFYKQGNKIISHLVDPHTGYPVDNDLVSVTVLAQDAIIADGYDNAFMVMGLEKSLLFLDSRKDLEAYFIYKKANGAIADTATAGFYKLLE